MLLLSSFAACTGPPDPVGDELLDTTFGARLTTGFHCGAFNGGDWYLAHDEDQTIRLGTDIAHPDPTDEEEVPVTLGGGYDRLQVWIGECLYVNPGWGCTDVFDVPPCGEQHISHAYEAVAGDATLRWVDGDVITGTVIDLILEGRNGEPAVEVAELTLPALPRWEY